MNMTTTTAVGLGPYVGNSWGTDSLTEVLLLTDIGENTRRKKTGRRVEKSDANFSFFSGGIFTYARLHFPVSQ